MDQHLISYIKLLLTLSVLLFGCTTFIAGCASQATDVDTATIYTLHAPIYDRDNTPEKLGDLIEIDEAEEQIVGGTSNLRYDDFGRLIYIETPMPNWETQVFTYDAEGDRIVD